MLERWFQDFKRNDQKIQSDELGVAKRAWSASFGIILKRDASILDLSINKLWTV